MTASTVVDRLVGDDGRLLEIPTGKISPSPDNPRRQLGDLTPLTASVKARGVVEPLIVTANGDGWTIVAGHRRHAAAKAAGLKTVPCVVRAYDPDEEVAVRLVENLHRTDLDPIEEAAGFAQLKELGWNQRKIAAEVGCSQPHVSRRLQLLELPDDALDALDSGALTIETALDFVQLQRRDADTAKRALDSAKGSTERGVNDYNLSTRIHSAVSELDDRDRRASRIAELEADGVKVIDLPDTRPHQTADALDKPAVPIDGPRAADIPTDGHDTEPCHAVAVLRWSWRDSLHEVPVCTEPSRHGFTGRLAERRAAQHDAEREAAEQAREAAWEASRARQKAAVRAVASLTDTTKPALASGLTRAAALLIDVHSYQLSGVADLLGITYDERSDVVPLVAERAATDVGALQVIHAIWLHQCEGRLRGQTVHHANPRGDAAGRDYLRWLVRHGHQPSEVDRTILDQEDDDS